MDPRVADDVDKILTNIARDRKRVPNLADIVEQLIDQWGGARQFASSYYTEYKKASSVSFRGRMLESILRLMQVYAAQAGPQEEISGLTDEELRSVAQSLFEPFYARQKEADSRLQPAGSNQTEADQTQEVPGQASAASAASTVASAPAAN